ncbi:MAG: hypothetical protein WDW36_003381 [Sanguina aurantia]
MVAATRCAPFMPAYRRRAVVGTARSPAAPIDATRDFATDVDESRDRAGSRWRRAITPIACCARAARPMRDAAMRDHRAGCAGGADGSIAASMPVDASRGCGGAARARRVGCASARPLARAFAGVGAARGIDAIDIVIASFCARRFQAFRMLIALSACWP